MLKKFLPSLCLPLLLAGCSTPMIVTNISTLTPLRSTNNLYTVEIAVASNQQTLRWDSIHPQIVVGSRSYPMLPTQRMGDRWEGQVPVPPGTSSLHYHYRIDFKYNSWGPPKDDSVTTQDYTLRVLEPRR